jgi:hypothetical protein
LLAVALLGAIAVGHFRTTLDERLANERVRTEVRQRLHAEASKLGEARVPAGIEPAEKQQATRILHESFLRSVRVVMLICAAMALLSAVCGWFTMPAEARLSRAGAWNRASEGERSSRS